MNIYLSKVFIATHYSVLGLLSIVSHVNIDNSSPDSGSGTESRNVLDF